MAYLFFRKRSLANRRQPSEEAGRTGVLEPETSKSQLQDVIHPTTTAQAVLRL